MLLAKIFETNTFAWFVYFAVHLIWPPATFSPSDAEKELFCGTFSHQLKEAATPSDISQRVFRISF
jgi:hypothetical protein